MGVLRIVTVSDGDGVIRRSAAPVRRMDGRIRALLDDLVDTMRDAPGVGLAAPQVGLSCRLIVVEAGDRSTEPAPRLLKLGDPEIVWKSPEIEEGQEACLSIPDLYGDVPRHLSIKVRAVDVTGRRVEIEASGFEARVLQHEIDHLDGILFPDRVTGLDKLYYLEEDADGNLARVPVPSVETAEAVLASDR